MHPNQFTYLLEFSFSDKVITMLWSGSPANAVIGIKLDSCTSFLFVDDLETVIVDKHVCGTTLQFIGRNGLFDGFNGWCDDRAQTFLINRTLDGDVRKVLASDSGRSTSRVELGVDVHLSDWTKQLRQTSNDDLSEEESEEDLDWC